MSEGTRKFGIIYMNRNIIFSLKKENWASLWNNYLRKGQMTSYGKFRIVEVLDN